jgi:hypothetical protein
LESTVSTFGRVFDRVVEKVFEDLMQPLWICSHRRDVLGQGELDRQSSRVSALSYDLNLLLQLRAEVDRCDVQRNRARLDAREVEQLLCHAEHALRFLVDDGRSAAALDVAQQIPIDERLAETDQARERCLELVRYVGEELALDLPCALHRLGHAIER